MVSLIGQHLGQYEIIGELGKGGMATVYRARQPSINRDVAIKVIKSDLAEQPAFVARFKREAQTIAQLSNPHILNVFDYGQQDDLIYLVMGLLKGGSLADLLRQGPLPVKRALRLLEQIASALDTAHKQGVVHRDVKPQNVLLDEEGNAYLSDFGLAKMLGETSALTQSGMAMGTPAYMSPEQWEGRGVDARTDLYALGIMLFEMLTGTTPFSAETPVSMMHRHIYEEPRSLHALRPDLPAAVDSVLSRALAKKPQNRFGTAGQLYQAFKDAVAEQEPDISSTRTGNSSFVPTDSQTVLLGTRGATRRRISAGKWALVAIAIAAAALLAGKWLSALTQPPAVTILPTLTQAAVIAARPTISASPTVSLVPVTPSPMPPTLTTTPTSTTTASQTVTPTSSMTVTASPTATSSPTATVVVLTHTPSPVPLPTRTDVPAVKANKDWLPVIQQFDGVDMVLVPPGCFQMGMPQAEADALDKQYTVTFFADEVPQTQVCFNKSFWIDRTDVTQAQFKKLGGQAASASYFTGDQRPVDSITWFEAHDYCADKRQARLPTEAEWEYTARGPDSLIYPWGNIFIAANVVFVGNANYQTANVGSKEAGKSWVGALDMVGNVAQWVNTLHKPYPYNASDGREDQLASGERVLRGSAFSRQAYSLRASERSRDLPSSAGSDAGFRCARSVENP